MRTIPNLAGWATKRPIRWGRSTSPTLPARRDRFRTLFGPLRWGAQPRCVQALDGLGIGPRRMVRPRFRPVGGYPAQRRAGFDRQRPRLTIQPRRCSRGGWSRSLRCSLAPGSVHSMKAVACRRLLTEMAGRLKHLGAGRGVEQAGRRTRGSGGCRRPPSGPLRQARALRHSRRSARPMWVIRRRREAASRHGPGRQDQECAAVSGPCPGVALAPGLKVALHRGCLGWIGCEQGVQSWQALRTA